MAAPRESLLGESGDERARSARKRLIEFGHRLERLAQQLQHHPEAVGLEMGELAALFPAMVTEASLLIRKALARPRAARPEELFAPIAGIMEADRFLHPPIHSI